LNKFEQAKMAAPRHVLLELDDDDDRSIASASSAALGIESSAASFSTAARGDLRSPPPPFEPADDDSRGDSDDGEDPSDGDDDRSPRAPERRRSARPTTVADEDGGEQTTSSRFWGVGWYRGRKKWQARYRDVNGKQQHVGYYDDEEEAARARDQAVRDAGLQGKRRMNAVDATGALVPKSGYWQERDRSAVVAPDPARDPTAVTSKFWGVTWCKKARRWKAGYRDANGKSRSICFFDTQEAAAHAYNAAIRALPPDVQARRKTNPVVDGQLVPKPLRKRSRAEEPAAQE
jgi:hypothetical protein